MFKERNLTYDYLNEDSWEVEKHLIRSVEQDIDRLVGLAKELNWEARSFRKQGDLGLSEACYDGKRTALGMIVDMRLKYPLALARIRVGVERDSISPESLSDSCVSIEIIGSVSGRFHIPYLRFEKMALDRGMSLEEYASGFDFDRVSDKARWWDYTSDRAA